MDFLKQGNISGLLPYVTRLIELRKACEAILPEHFAFSKVLQFTDKQLTIGVPSQAAAARLRQKLPLLQASLSDNGWDIERIRIKVKLYKDP